MEDAKPGSAGANVKDPMFILQTVGPSKAAKASFVLVNLEVVNICKVDYEWV